MVGCRGSYLIQHWRQNFRVYLPKTTWTLSTIGLLENFGAVCLIEPACPTISLGSNDAGIIIILWSHRLLGIGSMCYTSCWSTTVHTPQAVVRLKWVFEAQFKFQAETVHPGPGTRITYCKWKTCVKEQAGIPKLICQGGKVMAASCLV